ncbi:MAG: cyclic pyranopterin monophosphate synthase MoaC [Candidatus Omnitrophica bacterium]|nr:cyclic pyranopterin monophosphate synthase MoaC [Candidatus Omnitrophota bacterium]
MGMIDVGSKDITLRTAKATAFVKLDAKIIAKIRNNDMPKGNVLESARIAGILAAKKTPELIPLCHNIELNKVSVDFQLETEGIRIESIVKASAKTGVEMEAIVASFVAAITIYDMCKMFSKSIEITDVYLIEKLGGKSGVYKRKA